MRAIFVGASNDKAKRGFNRSGLHRLMDIKDKNIFDFLTKTDDEELFSEDDPEEFHEWNNPAEKITLDRLVPGSMFR